MNKFTFTGNIMWECISGREHYTPLIETLVLNVTCNNKLKIKFIQIDYQNLVLQNKTLPSQLSFKAGNS